MPKSPSASPPSSIKWLPKGGSIGVTPGISSLKLPLPATLSVHIALENGEEKRWTFPYSPALLTKLLSTASEVSVSTFLESLSYTHGYMTLSTTSKLEGTPSCSPQTEPSYQITWTDSSGQELIKSSGPGGLKSPSLPHSRKSCDPGAALGSASLRKSRRRKRGKNG